MHTLHIVFCNCAVFLCVVVPRVLCAARFEPLCAPVPLCALPPLSLVLYCACELKCVRSLLYCVLCCAALLGSGEYNFFRFSFSLNACAIELKYSIK